MLREVSRSLAAPIPLLVSLWEWPDPAGPAARRLLDAGATVIGMNCQPGIEAAVAFAERLDGQVRCPLLVKPSAGTPSRPDDGPACFAAAVPRLLDVTSDFLEVAAEPPMPTWRRWRRPAPLSIACHLLPWQEKRVNGRDQIETPQADP